MISVTGTDGGAPMVLLWRENRGPRGNPPVQPMQFRMVTGCISTMDVCICLL